MNKKISKLKEYLMDEVFPVIPGWELVGYMFWILLYFTTFVTAVLLIYQLIK